MKTIQPYHQPILWAIPFLVVMLVGTFGNIWRDAIALRRATRKRHPDSR